MQGGEVWQLTSAAMRSQGNYLSPAQPQDFLETPTLREGRGFFPRCGGESNCGTPATSVF